MGENTHTHKIFLKDITTMIICPLTEFFEKLVGEITRLNNREKLYINKMECETEKERYKRLYK